MSMQSWSIPGYGFPLYENDNFDLIKKFIIDNDFVEYSTKHLQIIKKCANVEELELIINDPLPWKVANIINKLENINFIEGYMPCADTEQSAMIGVGKQYPWEVNKDYNREFCDKILNKYKDILGITINPNFFDAEYYG